MNYTYITQSTLVQYIYIPKIINTNKLFSIYLINIISLLIKI